MVWKFSKIGTAFLKFVSTIRSLTFESVELDMVELNWTAQLNELVQCTPYIHYIQNMYIYNGV